MNIFKKLSLICLISILPLLFCACSKTNPPTNDELNKMFQSRTINLSEDFEIEYNQSDLINLGENSIILCNEAKIKISTNSITTNYLQNEVIATGFKINGKYFSFDFFEDNFYTLTSDAEVSIVYEPLKLRGILIYQNTPLTTNWSNVSQNLDSLSNKIQYDDSEISCDDKFMTHVLIGEDYTLSGNTVCKLTNNASRKNIGIEIFIETTEIATCLIYETENGETVFCEHKKINNLSNNLTIFETVNFDIYVSKNLEIQKG